MVGMDLVEAARIVRRQMSGRARAGLLAGSQGEALGMQKGIWGEARGIPQETSGSP